MKLTSKGRYAVMALADLARFDNINPVSLRDISLRQGISLDYLEQIFSKLRKKEIVQSVRGTQGGYILIKISSPSSVYPRPLSSTTKSSASRRERTLEM